MPAPPVEVRAARAADGPAAAALFARARAAAMPWLPVLHTPDEDAAFFTGALGSGRAWVAVDGGAVVGFAAASPGWLDHLYVDPAAQGRGAGSALLAAAQADQPDGFNLWVFARNTRARAFYAAHGLVEVEQTDGARNEEREPDVRCRWAPRSDPGAHPG